MSAPESATISFDVLLRGTSDDVSLASADLDKLRPPADAIEFCHRWLSEQGVTCHRTNFGLGCEAPVQLFERLFSVRVPSSPRNASAAASEELQSEPKPPQEIAHLVSQITIARPPTFFS